ncbi:MAG: hypothetical protein P8N51_12775 [Pseudomonadales bacterium]|jgi:hypothetical protein|nr:hypothetical protein [Pseudomonadales bacterium]MDG1441156.1 hypothetical protein [Pseudomonadales bacterium]
MRTRISRDEALSFILTYIIVEKSTPFQLDQLNLFNLTNLASAAAQKLSDEEGLIPHEVIEEVVAPFLSELQSKQSTSQHSK